MANKEFSHEQANRLVPNSPPHSLNTHFTHFIPSLFPLLLLAQLFLISSLVEFVVS